MKSACGGAALGKHFLIKCAQGPWPGASVSVRRLDQHCPAAKTTIGANRFFDVSEVAAEAAADYVVITQLLL
jgi:hypothetical protein